MFQLIVVAALAQCPAEGCERPVLKKTKTITAEALAVIKNVPTTVREKKPARKAVSCIVRQGAAGRLLRARPLKRIVQRVRR